MIHDEAQDWVWTTVGIYPHVAGFWSNPSRTTDPTEVVMIRVSNMCVESKSL